MSQQSNGIKNTRKQTKFCLEMTATARDPKRHSHELWWGAASCLPFYRHPCLGVLRVVFVHDARSPLGHSGADFVRRFFQKPPHCAFPPHGRSDPANVASASLRWPSLTTFAGWHPATGLRHAATSCRRRSAIYPGWRHRAEDCDDILSSLGSLGSGANRCCSPVNEKGHLAVASFRVISRRCNKWFIHLRDLTHLIASDHDSALFSRRPYPRLA